MELRFTDGTTTIEVLPAAGDAVLRRYTPRTAEIESIDTTRAITDGGERPITVYRNVTEQADILLEGDDAEQRATIAALNGLLQGARHRQRTGMGPAVFIEFRVDDTEDWYRSEMLSGRLLIDDADLELDLQLVTAGLELTVLFTRRFFWEGPEAQIPLTNGNGTNNITGLTVVNHDDADAGDDNYVAIAAVDVVGGLPAPPRLEITNTTDHERRSYRVYVGHNVCSNPATLAHILEGEDSTLGTPVISATSSGGFYQEATWAGTAATTLYEWTLTTALLNALAGNYVRVLGRLADLLGLAGGLWLQLRVRFAVTTIWQGPWVLGVDNRYIQDLGLAQLPPYLVGAGDLYPLTLQLRGRHGSSGDHTFDLDFLQLCPVDGWRRLEPKGYGFAYTVRLVDDMIADHLYTDGWTPAGKTGHYLAYGAPILLEPGRVQRLYFLHSTDTGTAPIDRTLSLKAFYRPRRLTL